MLCDICHRNESTIFYKETINKKTTEMHLCDECAEKKGISNIQIPLSIASFFSGMLEEMETTLPRERKEKECPYCNFRYIDFKEQGKLGCSKCYETFKEQLMPLLRRIHGATQHKGKIPSNKSPLSDIEKEIAYLQQELDKSIKVEEYERAAQLRDQIKKLKEK